MTPEEKKRKETIKRIKNTDPYKGDVKGRNKLDHREYERSTNRR
jgi:hypothetical protein